MGKLEDVDMRHNIGRLAGCIHAAGIKLDIINSRFISNAGGHVHGSGGVIYGSMATISINKSLFVRNSGNEGGAITVHGYHGINLQIANTSFLSNGGGHADAG